MEKNIFLFDQNKCVGCHACIIACINENGFQAPDQWRNVYNSNNSHFPHLPLFYLSLACNHCDDAPCLKNCPTLAYSRDEKTGAVIHNPEKCIGCKYCTWACPYDAPKYNSKTGVIEKCTFCNSRILENLTPACANLCPVGALNFTQTEFTREESIESSPAPVNVGSNIKINTLRKNNGPEMDQSLFKNQSEERRYTPKHQKISAIEEWPLVVFTLLSTGLVSLYVSGITNLFTSIHKLLYIGFGIFATILSMAHLGKKNRAWRSVINLKNSWLSREIILFGLFFLMVFCDFYLFNLPNLFVTAIGILFLIAIDMIYRLAMWQWPINFHSAQTILIGITYYALLTSSFYLIVFILSLRITLYIYRKFVLNKSDLAFTIARITLPILSAVLYYISQDYIISLALLFLGDLIDRIEFYNELNVPDLPTELF